MPTRIEPSQTRSAIRPIFRLPATSWAEPGATSVIAINASARRNRTRAARSATLDCPTPGWAVDAVSSAMRVSLLPGKVQ